MARTRTSSTTSSHRSTGWAGRSTGFTLVELMVVLGLLSLAYVLVAPSLNKAMGIGENRVASRELLAALREARATAIAESREVRFIVDGVSASYGAGQVRAPIPRGFDIASDVPASRRLTARIAAIDFFPDGSSTGGAVVLAMRGGGRTTIAIDWLTGHVGMVE